MTFLFGLFIAVFQMVTAPASLVMLGGAWLALFAYILVSPKSTRDDGRVRRFLQSRTPGKTYERSMNWLLGGVQALLQRPAMDTPPVPQTRNERLDRYMAIPAETEHEARSLATRAFGWPVLDKALLIAFGYVVLLALAHWIFLGGALCLGDVCFFTAGTHLERLVALGVLLLFGTKQLVISRLANHPNPSVQKWSKRWDTTTLLLAAAVALPLAQSGAFTGAFVDSFEAQGGNVSDDPVWFLIAVCTVVFIIYGFFWALEHTGAVVVIAITLFAPWLWIATLFESAITRFVGTAALFFMIYALAGLTGYLTGKRKGARAFLLIYLAAFSALAACLLLLDWSTANPHGAALLLFSTMLPLMNALFDFISYGVTLTLMRRGLRSKDALISFGLGLLDLAFALVMFLALGIGLVATVAAANRLTEGAFLQLGDVFSGLSAGGPEYAWVYAMLFSTFVPTAVHFALASFSLQGRFLSKTRGHLLNWYELAGEDNLKFWIGAAGIATVWLGFLILPFIAIGGLAIALWQMFPTLGQVYINGLTNFAMWLSGGVLH